MMVDWGLGLRRLDDALTLGGDYVDLGKIAIKERQHEFLGAGKAHLGERRILGFAEGIVERLGDPGIGLVIFAPDSHQMHDRMDAGASEIILFLSPEIGEQALHIS